MLGPWYKNPHGHQGPPGMCTMENPMTSIGHSMHAHEMMIAAVSRDNPRDARNKAEKQRRDKLNGSINELATLVPLVAESSRKIDKTGILRLTAHDLRKEHVFGNSMGTCHMKLKPQVVDTLINMMGGFLITTTCKGIILVVTTNIEQYLGHCQTDLLGQNILNLTHPDDIEKLKKELMPRETPIAPNGQLLALPSTDTTTQEEDSFKEERRDFQIRLARAVQRSEVPQYELCRMDGSLRRADRATPGSNSAGQVVRRHRARGDEAISPSGNDVVFIGMVHIVKQSCLTDRLIEASKQEYRTRHLIDGRIVQCDQRISVVAGYLTNEISGVSGFTFMHKEDVRWVIIALRQMYDRNKQYGESCYRFMSKTGEFIYLKTKGYLEISHGSNAVQSFVCMNTLVSEEEGRNLIEDMKKKYSAIISASQAEYPFGTSGEASVEDPQQLEQVIMHLITNLPSPAHMLPQRSPSPIPTTPPPCHSLSIIPPKPSTIKTTIAKSVSVINQAIKLRIHDDVVTTETGNPTSSNSTCFTTLMSRPSVVQRHSAKVDCVTNTCVKPIEQAGDVYSLKNKQLTENISEESKDNARIPSLSPKIYHTFSANESIPVIENTFIDNVNYHSNTYPLQELPGLDCASQIGMVENTDYGDSLYNNAFSCNSGVIGDAYSSKQDDSDLKPNVISSSDALLKSLQVLVPDDSLSDFHVAAYSDKLSVKRPRMDVNMSDPSQSSKRRIACSEGDNIVIEELTSAVSQGTDNYNNGQILQVAPHRMHNVKLEDGAVVQTQEEGFDNYIHQLTDPNSDLCVVVPKSLAALESSMMEIDGHVHQMNVHQHQYQPSQQQNLSEMIMEHQEHRQIFESIQLDHRNIMNEEPTHQGDNMQRENLSPAPCLDG